MVLVSDIARLAAKIELALTTMVLVSDIAKAPNVNLVASTAMVDWSKISNWALEIVEPATAMVLVAVMFTAGSNVPLE